MSSATLRNAHPCKIDDLGLDVITKFFERLPCRLDVAALVMHDHSDVLDQNQFWHHEGRSPRHDTIQVITVVFAASVIIEIGMPLAGWPADKEVDGLEVIAC